MLNRLFLLINGEIAMSETEKTEKKTPAPLTPARFAGPVSTGKAGKPSQFLGAASPHNFRKIQMKIAELEDQMNVFSGGATGGANPLDPVLDAIQTVLKQQSNSIRKMQTTMNEFIKVASGERESFADLEELQPIEDTDQIFEDAALKSMEIKEENAENAEKALKEKEEREEAERKATAERVAEETRRQHKRNAANGPDFKPAEVEGDKSKNKPPAPKPAAPVEETVKNEDDAENSDDKSVNTDKTEVVDNSLKTSEQNSKQDLNGNGDNGGSSANS